MAADRSILPYVPQAIRFRDADKLRPVAPFFELRTRIQESDGAIREAPLALSILDEFGLGPSDIRFAITVANKKAQRRTQQASCGFIARIDTNGTALQLVALGYTNVYNTAAVVTPRRKCRACPRVISSCITGRVTVTLLVCSVASLSSSC